MTCLISYGERDQILIPDGTGAYTTAALLNLLHIENIEGLGMRNHRFITQRSPYQFGETPLAVFWDTTTLQIAMQERFIYRTRYYDRRWELLDQLRPNRSFRLGHAVKPLIYRRWLPGGDEAYQGHDLELTAGSAYVTAKRGRFVDRGLPVGGALTISSAGVDNGTYQVLSVLNDYTVLLDTAMTNDLDGAQWAFTRGPASRDFNCFAEQGPALNLMADDRVAPHGFKEVLRFVGFDPFWYVAEQSQSWAVADAIGDLVFDGLGAWFGKVPGEGRWLFASGVIGEQIEVVYWGHELAKPIIEIDGPALSPVTITHSELGVTLTYSRNIVAGETVTLDFSTLQYTNNFGLNLTQYVSGDVATFGLTPDVPERTNTINISFDGGAAGASAARLLWRNTYVGI